MEKEYKYLGWANSWKEDPEIVKQCKAKGHKLSHKSFDWHGLNNEAWCHKCRYFYKYDSS